MRHIPQGGVGGPHSCCTVPGNMDALSWTLHTFDLVGLNLKRAGNVEPFVEVGVHGSPVTCIPSHCYLVSSIVSEGVWYRRALATFGLGLGLGSATRAFGAPAVVGIPLPSATH
jgi:hypothetical protein